MNRLLLRGGLCRATRCSGSPLLQTGCSVRHQSSEEVAQDRHDHEDIDGVEGGHSANTLTSDCAPPRQVNGSSTYHGNRDIARPPRQPDAWSKLGTQLQNGLDGDHHHYSRSGPGVASDRAGVSAPAALPWGALNGAAFSPVSRVNGKVAPAGSEDEGHKQIVHGASEFGTGAISRSMASRLHDRERQHTSNSSDSRTSSNKISSMNSSGQARNPWDMGLPEKPNDHRAGPTVSTKLEQPSRVEGVINGIGVATTAATAAASAANRSDSAVSQREPLSWTSNLKV